MKRASDPELRWAGDYLQVVFQSAWFWFGVLVACYCVSGIWLGEFFRVPYFVVPVAPSGLLHLIGLHDFDNGFYVFDGYFKAHPVASPLLLFFVHALFWWGFIYLLWKRKRMSRTVLFRFSWTILAVLAANLIGCSSMSYSS